MSRNIISEEKALQIVDEFIFELKSIDDKNLLAVYVIGSLGGGYYRAGQSDIDTVIIVNDRLQLTQEQVDDIATKFYRKYDVPKGFGSIMISENELFPPYDRSKVDEFAFSIEIARLKIQGKIIYGDYNLDDVPLPSRDQLIEDEAIMQNWLNSEFGYPGFDKLGYAGCINSILGSMRTYLMIEKSIYEFNKFKTINTYMSNNPPIVDNEISMIINSYLQKELLIGDEDHEKLREFGIKIRDYFNVNLLDLNFL